MTKRTFKDKRYREFNGGINVRDYPTEIQDKQGVSIVNFNFDGNKLVSSKGLIEKYNLPASTSIKGMLVDGTDVYFMTGGKIYKNGVELTILSGGPLPDKKGYMSIWWDVVFITFDDGTEAPFYLETDTGALSSVAGIGEPRYNIIYNGKWILGGYGNDNIYFSKTASPTAKADIFDFGAYSAGNQSVGGDSKGEITGFIIGENGLYVSKKDAFLYSNTEKDTGTTFNFIFNKITSTGAINQNAMCEVQQDIVYFDGKKVRRLSYEKDLTTLRDTAISDEIDDLFLSLDDNQDGCTIHFNYPNVKLVLQSRLVGEGVNDNTYVYNVDNKGWATELNKDCSVAKKGFIGSAYEGVVYQDDIGTSILGAEATGEFLSKQYSFGDPIDYKKYGEFEIAGNLDSTTELTITIIVDGEEVDTRVITTDEVLTGTLGTKALGNRALGGDENQIALPQFRERIELYSSGQWIQIFLSYKGIGRLEISNMNFRWKPDLAYGSYA